MTSLQELRDKLVSDDPALIEVTIDLSLAELRSDDDKMEIFDSLGRNKTLLQLVIENGSLSMRAILSLAAAISRHPTLTKLDLTDVDVGASFGVLVHVVQQSKTLKTLHLVYIDAYWTSILNEGTRCLLASNALDELSIMTSFQDNEGRHHDLDLAGVLSRNVSLRKLHIDDGNIATEQTARDVALMLRSNNSVESLELGNLFHYSAVDLIAVAATGHESLQRLELELDEGVDAYTFEAQAMSNMIRNSPDLKKLMLKSFNIQDTEACLLFDSLKSNRCNLIKLDIETGDLTHSSLARLADSLSKNKTLQELRLHVNSVEGTCASFLVKVLDRNSTLEKFRFHGCAIGPEGMASISESLARNKSLKELSIDLDPTGSDGAKTLARMLTVNTTLESLRVGGFGNGNLSEWSRNLPEMSGLKSLVIDDMTDLTQKSTKDFLEAMERNTTLQSVRLGDYSEQHDEELKGILKRIDLLATLNRGGRRIIKSSNVPSVLWPLILAKSCSEPDVLYYFIREKSIDFVGAEQVPTSPPSRKRKRGD